MNLLFPIGVRVAAVMACVFLPNWASAQDYLGEGPLPPEQAILMSLAIDPAVRQAEINSLVAHGQRSQSAIFLNNPTVSGSLSLDGSRSGVQLSQPLSITGQGWFTRSAARHNVDATDAAFERSQRVAAAAVLSAYLNAVVAVDLVRVASDGVEAANKLHFAVEMQHKEGMASTLDLRLARLAQVQAVSSLLSAQNTQAKALVVLSSKVGASLSPENLVDDVALVVPASSSSSSSSSASERADVVAAAARSQAAVANQRAQRAAAIPAVSVGAFLEVEDDSQFVGPSISMNLPLFSRNQTGRAAAKGAVLQADGAYRAVQAKAKAEVSLHERRVTQAQALVSGLVEDPVQEAREALMSVEQGYLAGEIDLQSAVLLQKTILNGEAAAISVQGSVSGARLDLLLANDDDALTKGAR